MQADTNLINVTNTHQEYLQQQRHLTDTISRWVVVWAWAETIEIQWGNSGDCSNNILRRKDKEAALEGPPVHPQATSKEQAMAHQLRQAVA